ncbi:MAG: hypothetical protein AAFN70_11960, partial [Planctomycetota bacterium]
VYRINRFDGLAVRSLAVDVVDNDRAGIVVDQSRGVDLDATVQIVDGIENITAIIEGGDGDHRGEQDVLMVRLARQPSANVNVRLDYDGNQLAISDLTGTAIAGNLLAFNSSNWDQPQPVVIAAMADLVREGFHTELLQFVVMSADTDQTQTTTDAFDIPLSEPVTTIGLQHLPSEIISVQYNNQTLQQYDLSAGVVGTLATPTWQRIDNQLVFRADTGFAPVTGNTLRVNYRYINAGYDATFTDPVLVRIEDADAPSVLIRETGGSTDVVEGAPHFTVVTFAGTGFAPESLVGRRVHVSAGTGAGQTAIITSNTENTITLDQQWATTLDASSRISIDGSDAVQSSTRAIITGRMPGPFQPNHHAVHLIAGVHYRIDLEGLATGKGDNRDPFLWVYNQNGHRITRNDDGGVGLNSALTLRAGYTGRHTLIAGAYGFNFGSYTLTTRIQDEIPGNINTSIPVNQGGSLGSTLSFSGDEDWYAVDMQIGLQYTFDAIGASGGGGSLANPGLRQMVVVAENLIPGIVHQS